MARKPFDPSELVPIGNYPSLFGGRPGAPRYDRPVSPRENIKLYFERKKPYWIPVMGMMGEVLGFRPRMHPDNVATHLVVDGEGPMEYAPGNVQEGWFGLMWQFVPLVNGATVRPGAPTVPDMARWEEYVHIPDLDEMDWERSAEANRAWFAASDQFHEVCCLSGLWERLISLCDVEGAAVALIDEDQKEGVHRFFSALCDMYEDMIARYARYFDLDMLLMHDDWGTQNAPFFSLDTCREMIVPYLKRIVDACHRNGLRFELHCCGQVEALVPAMIEAGADIWCGQTLNDYVRLSGLYPDTCLTFGMTLPAPAEDATEEELRTAARDFVELCKDRRLVLNGATDPRLQALVYEESRKYYAQFDD